MLTNTRNWHFKTQKKNLKTEPSRIKSKLELVEFLQIFTNESFHFFPGRLDLIQFIREKF